MTFLNPIVLFGLLAAAIPLIIHLFNLRKPRRVDFSTVAFLKELQKSTMRRVRIKQWLLLALRMLAVAMLVLAFARPTLKGSLAGVLGSQSRSAMAVVLDNSYSMTLRDRNGAYFEQARDVALDIADQVSPGDEFTLLTTSAHREASVEPLATAPAARDAAAQQELAFAASPLATALQRAIDVIVRSQRLNREIYLISDLQASTFVDSARIDLPPDVKVFLVPVGEGRLDNLSVRSITIESRIVEAGQPARIRARIKNHGRVRVDNYVASLYLEGDRVAQSTVGIEAGATADVEFTVVPESRGWLPGRVEIEEDGFPHDDTRHFVLHVPERRRILIVSPGTAVTRYIDLALSSDLSDGRVAFEVEHVAESALSSVSLVAFDAVVLVGVSDLATGEAARLSAFVREGKGLMLFPAAGERYDVLLPALETGVASEYVGAQGGDRAVASFERIDREHPLFEGVFSEEPEEANRPPESPEIYYAAVYRSGDGTEQELITLSNGLPFLREVQLGEGRILLAAVSPDPGWSDLPVRGFFVPFLYRSIFYLAAGDGAVYGELELASREPVRVPGVGDVGLRLVSPTGEEYVPEQRPLLGGILIQIPNGLDEVGVYDVEGDSGVLRRIALNMPASESELERLSSADASEQLERALDHPVTVLASPGGSQPVAAAISEQRFGVELWNVFLTLALVFLVTEMLVAVQWRPAG